MVKRKQSIINHQSSIIAKRLDELLANVGDMALKRRARRIIEELNPQDDDKILDVGCGNGYYSYLLAHLPARLDLTGVDNDDDALRDAKIFVASTKVKLVKSDITKMPFDDSTFDKAVMSEVIEHLDNPVEALEEIKRVLKPGGVLAITTTNRDYPFLWDPVNWTLEWLLGFHIKSGFWAGIWNQHTKLFTPNKLKGMVEKAGLKVEKVESLTGWCLPFNHYFLNLAAKLLYDKHLPGEVADSISKFKAKQRKPFWIRIIFWFVNTFDRLNDIFPGKSGVSIFVKVEK